MTFIHVIGCLYFCGFCSDFKFVHIKILPVLLFILFFVIIYQNICFSFDWYCNYCEFNILYFPAHKMHRDFFIRNFRKKKWWMYFNFSNLLEENNIVTYQNQQPQYNLFIVETQKIIVTATKIIFMVVCSVIHDFNFKCNTVR